MLPDLIYYCSDILKLINSIWHKDDVYRDSRSINFLQGEDLEDIKNLKNCYDTKDEAIEKLTAYIS